MNPEYLNIKYKSLLDKLVLRGEGRLMYIDNPEKLEKLEQRWLVEDSVDKIADAIRSTNHGYRPRFLGLF